MMAKSEAVIIFEDGERLDTLVGSDGNVAFLFTGTFSLGPQLRFRSRGALNDVIAALLTMQQEWDRTGREAEEFAAEGVN